MKTLLESMGLTSSDLDSLIDDAASQIATNMNNEGMSSQLSFLNTNGYSDGVILKIILMDRLEVGMVVDVDDPKHPNSTHSNNFTGNVVEITDEWVTVEDMEQCVFDVAFDEITAFRD